MFMGAIVMHLVYKGSKNSFAYILLAFCIWDGVSNILYFFETAYVLDVQKSDGDWFESF